MNAHIVHQENVTLHRKASILNGALTAQTRVFMSLVAVQLLLPTSLSPPLPIRLAPCQLGSCAVHSELFDGYHPVPPKSVSALFPPVTVRVADNAASTDLNVKGMMRMTTDP